ncbi:hypothetical protein ACH5RR_001576 [Cinchona calisaya]|uniref:Uncharacterized protein n=1 Tax=Cinchona calisaya TaxID=153742 RepID=A0ABD3B3W4_9GENT
MSTGCHGLFLRHYRATPFAQKFDKAGVWREDATATATTHKLTVNVATPLEVAANQKLTTKNATVLWPVPDAAAAVLDYSQICHAIAQGDTIAGEPIFASKTQQHAEGDLLAGPMVNLNAPRANALDEDVGVVAANKFAIEFTAPVDNVATIEVINANATGQELVDDDTTSLGSIIGDATAQEAIAEVVVDPKHATNAAARGSMLLQLTKVQFVALFAADQVRKIGEQTTVAAAQSNTVGVCTSKSTSSASNARPFAVAQKCIASMKSKNSAMEGVHNSKILDISQANYNSIIQYNTVGIPLDPEIDDGTVGPPKYILALPSNVKVMEKVEKQASRLRMTAQAQLQIIRLD